MRTIQTKRLTLRSVEAGDWKSIQRIWEDFNTSPFVRYDKPHCTEDEDVCARIARWADANHGTGHMFFAVCLGDSIIGYHAFNVRENGYELGYCFHSAYHGRGYAKESLLGLFDYLLSLDIHRVTAGTAMDNTPSIKLLTALGFRLTGTEAVSFYKDDKGQDIVFEGGIFEKML